MKVSAKTDRGLVRKKNEDSVAFGALSDGKSAYAVVCDGMGGAACGEVASSIACKIISERLKASFKPDMTASSVKNLLLSAVSSANLQVYEYSNCSPTYAGMGTTVVAAIITEEYAAIVSAGDSRAYLINDDSIKQITKDHSYVQEMVDNGLITADEARVHPQKNLITRALGTSDTLECDYYSIDLHPDSLLLMCSDGLTNFVSDADILDIVRGSKFDLIVKSLIETADKNGGEDNITALIAAHNDK